MDLQQEIAQSIVQVRAKKPLIHHLTNYVTVNDCANITLAIGASPVMANDINEVEEMISYAAALVLNMGAINPGMAAAMLATGKKAKILGIPIVFDPVGVGATSFRMEIARRILGEVKPDVIKGNAAEIKSLAGRRHGTKGVDSTADESDIETVAFELADRLNCIVAVTGKKDIIVSSSESCLVENGHEMLANVTGTGCMATSLIASFCGAVPNYFTAAIAGITVMGVAGEIAHESLNSTEGTGTFKIRLFDVVSTLTEAKFNERARLSFSKEGKINAD